VRLNDAWLTLHITPLTDNEKKFM